MYFIYKGTPMGVSGGTKPTGRTITLTADSWAGTAAPYSQTVSVAGVLADEAAQLVQIVPAADSMDAWEAAVVRCTAQTAGKLTFTAKGKPGGDLKIFVVLQEVAG